MNFDFSPGGFGEPQFVDQGVAGFAKTNHKAILYLFPPNGGKLDPVAIRSLNYSFDENFLGGVGNLLELGKRGTVGASSMIRQLSQKHNFNDNMMTGFFPDATFRADLLSDRWRFVLILTEAPSDLQNASSMMSTFDGSSSRARYIYNGYFEDEPINHLTGTPNPHCWMIITHKTALGTSREHDGYGTRTFLNTYASEQIVNTDVAANLIVTNQGQTPHIMTPDNCITSVESNGMGDSLSVPGAHSGIFRGNGSEFVPNFLEQPGQNVRKALTGIFLANEDMTASRRLNTNGSRFVNDPFIDEDFQRGKMAQFMQSPRFKTNSRFDLNVNARISTKTLDDMVGGQLEIVTYNFTRPMFQDKLDTNEKNIINQYSSLISFVVPAILSSAGLDGIEFTYAIVRRHGDVHDEWKVFSKDPNYDVPLHDLEAMTLAVQNELANGIFRTIFESQGDFHVAVKASVVGFTQVRLSLLAHGIRNTVDFEVPSCFGGLITPLIGCDVTHIENSQKMEALHNLASGIPTGSGTFDGRAYTPSAFDTSQFGSTSFDDYEALLDFAEDD